MRKSSHSGIDRKGKGWEAFLSRRKERGKVEGRGPRRKNKKKKDRGGEKARRARSPRTRERKRKNRGTPCRFLSFESPRLLLAAASSLQSIECLLFSTQVKHAFEFFHPVPNWCIIVMRSGAKEGEGKAFSFEINALFPFLFARSGLSCETPGKSECPVLAGCLVLLLLSSSTKAHVRFSRKPSVRSGEGLKPRKGKEWDPRKASCNLSRDLFRPRRPLCLFSIRIPLQSLSRRCRLSDSSNHLPATSRTPFELKRLRLRRRERSRKPFPSFIGARKKENEKEESESLEDKRGKCFGV